MEPFLNAARVFVSPIVVGTGLNVKNLVALEYGLPLVTTVIGAEGLRLMEVMGDGVSVRAQAMVATDPQGMADAIVMLHQNKARNKQQFNPRISTSVQA
jgi:glycosyltransferase involved in cell wall biosynthesis